MQTLRPFVLFGCSLVGASAIALAVPATSSADNCLLGIHGLVCTNGILNSNTLGPNIGIGNSVGINRGILNSPMLNIMGLIKVIVNKGSGDDSTTKQGLL